MANQQQKPRFSVAITTPEYQTLINRTLGDPERAKRFIGSITSAVAVNPELQKCEAGSILAGALLGESLNLSPSPQIGQYYLVPFKDGAATKANGGIEVYKAQFILGYKGYIQLAIRSGQYTKLSVIEIKQGELKRFDPLNEEIECILIDDWNARNAAPTMGYYAMFEHMNGFRKPIYFSYEQMLAHADKYSPAFSAKRYLDLVNGRIPGLTLQMIQDGAYIGDKELYKIASKMSSFRYKDFDTMAKKTMLRQLISKWGVMSTEMVSAYEKDNSIVEVNGRNELTVTSDNSIGTSEVTPEMLTPEVEDYVTRPDLSEPPPHVGYVGEGDDPL